MPAKCWWPSTTTSPRTRAWSPWNRADVCSSDLPDRRPWRRGTRRLGAGRQAGQPGTCAWQRGWWCRRRDPTLTPPPLVGEKGAPPRDSLQPLGVKPAAVQWFAGEDRRAVGRWFVAAVAASGPGAPVARTRGDRKSVVEGKGEGLGGVAVRGGQRT